MMENSCLDNRHLIFINARHVEGGFPELTPELGPWLDNVIKDPISYFSSISPSRHVDSCLKACHLMIARWLTAAQSSREGRGQQLYLCHVAFSFASALPHFLLHFYLVLTGGYFHVDLGIGFP